MWRTGHKRPAFVAGEVDVTTNLDRAKGFILGLSEAGLSLHAHEIGGAFSFEAGYDAARRLISSAEPPDSIFFASDIMAIGGIEAIRGANLNVPADISVVGFDDIPNAAWPAYQLSTVRQPMSEMIDTAVQMLGLGSSRDKKVPRKVLFLPGMLIERLTVMNRLRAEVSMPSRADKVPLRLRRSRWPGTPELAG